MAIIGWFCLVILMCFPSMWCLLAMFNYLGPYTIGGIPNSILSKVLTFVGLGIVVKLWVLLISAAPFTTTLQ